MTAVITSVGIASAGVALLLLLLVDVVQTVFVPRGDAGPLTRRVHRAVWATARRVVRRGPRRRRLLGLVGPVLLPLTVLLWAVELVVGFALVYLPLHERFVVPEDGATPGPAALALYVSGYAATTLGVGDISAGDTLVRLLVVLEAACGFAVFSVGIAYAMSVFSGLSMSTALAHEISTYLDTDELSILAAAARGGPADEQEPVTWLAGIAGRLAQVAQAQEQYALLTYFHVPDDARALPVAATRLLEVLTVARSLVDPASAPQLTEGPTVRFASRTLVAHVRGRAQAVGGAPEPAPRAQQERDRSCARALAGLRAADVPLRTGGRPQERYDELRAEWDGASSVLLRHFGYDHPDRPSDGPH